MVIVVWEELWAELLSAFAKGVLFVVYPIAKNIQVPSNTIFKEEVKHLLEKHELLNDFENGKLKCACCQEKLSYNNLGLIKEGDQLSIICKHPGCSLKT
jgi:hypothetical protein